MTRLAFPVVDAPLVSVVIVAYGGWRWLELALEALIERTDRGYEVLIVDNASPDGTAERLRERVTGATLLFNDENLGFPTGANQGAARARGRYLCVLNSDALVQEGWLPPLVEALEEGPSVGATVPLFLNPDGTVQEAGSLIDAEGWAFALGAGESAERLDLRFRRDIDFGSAACLLVRRDIFEDLGGFDPRYGVGYYEDADLAFRLHERGLRIVYEPRSRVVHVRFGSGTQEAATALVQRNRMVFLERWGSRLRTRPRLVDVAGHPGRILRARDNEAVERFLVVCGDVPGANELSANLVALLVRMWPNARCTLVALEDSTAGANAQRLLATGVEVAVAEPDWQAWLEQRQYHYSLVLVCNAAAGERLVEALLRTQPQAPRVFVSRARRLSSDYRPARADAALPVESENGIPRELVRTLAELGVAPPKAR